MDGLTGSLLVDVNSDSKTGVVLFKLELQSSSLDLRQRATVCFSDSGDSRGLSIYASFFRVVFMENMTHNICPTDSDQSDQSRYPLVQHPRITSTDFIINNRQFRYLLAAVFAVLWRLQEARKF